jgi:hypothetical protein
MPKKVTDKLPVFNKKYFNVETEGKGIIYERQIC